MITGKTQKNITTDAKLYIFNQGKNYLDKKDKGINSYHYPEEAQTIIDKWGSTKKSKDEYIFPYVNSDMDEQSRHDTVHKLTWLINKHVKRIAEDIGIDKLVTTYYTHHSFATIMQNNGAPVAMISKAFGHNSVSTTQNYLGSLKRIS